MKNQIHLLVVLLTSAILSCQPKEEYVELFNGKDLSGWKANENADCFKVEDGLIVANGLRSHLYYMGNGDDPVFKNFELIAEIKTKKLANSGVYFHLGWEDTGWPSTGVEAQVNATHLGGGDYREFKKAGSLYGVRNLYKSHVTDDQWYTMRVLVEGRRVRIYLNDLKTVDYIVPLDNKRFGQGMFALQGHDLESTVYFKSVKVKRLPDDLNSGNVPETDSYSQIMEYAGNQYPFIDYNVAPKDSAELGKLVELFYKSGVNLGVKSFNGLNLDDYPVFQQGKDYQIGSLEGSADEILGGIAMNEIDIWTNTAAIEGFSEEEKKEILIKAKENQLAIGISSSLEQPSLELIKLAKEAGCMFATIDLIDDSGNVNVDYYILAIDEAGLHYRDMYIPATNEYPNENN